MIDTTRTRTVPMGFVGAVMAVLAAGSGARSASSPAADRIRLDPDMLINLSGQRPAVELVDEQDLAGDPRTGDASQPKTSTPTAG